MKNIFKSIVLIAAVAILGSCEKDEGKLPEIYFKTGGSYISSDATVAGGTNILIGIEAKKEEKKDVLKKFNISKSIDGGTATSVYDHDMTGSEEDEYSYDYTETLDTTSGQINTYTFTVTNRDGLVNQVSCKITIQ